MLPILYQSPDLTLYSYPLLMGLGWGVAYQVFFGLVAEHIQRRYALLLYWGIFLFAWIGAKFLFYLTLPKELSANLLNEVSFWTGGGFVFYGGFLGGLVFLLIYRLFQLPLNRDVLWAFLPALTLGHAIGRIGCFLAGCCFGSETELWWGIHLHGEDRHPTQLLESISLFLLSWYLLKSKKPRSLLVYHYLLFYGGIRFIIEILRGDIIRGQWGFFTPSQWISLGLIISGLFFLIISKKSIPYPIVNK
jgi:phosphatidylglycerol:prolipoprotein diacylglycerol transferase